MLGLRGSTFIRSGDSHRAPTGEPPFPLEAGRLSGLFPSSPRTEAPSLSQSPSCDRRSRQDLNLNPEIRSLVLYPVELRDHAHAARRSFRSDPDCTMRI